LEFKLPVVSLLESLPSKNQPNQTMLGELVTRLYIEAGMSQKDIAKLLCISEAAVQVRISKDAKHENRISVVYNVRYLHELGKVPKEIAWEMQIPLKRVYAILKGGKK